MIFGWFLQFVCASGKYPPSIEIDINIATPAYLPISTYVVFVAF